MNLVTAFMRLRFECFQHVPEELRYRMARRLMSLPLENPETGTALLGAFNHNQFQVLERTVSALKRKKEYIDLRQYPRVDTDLILSLFWHERDPATAERLLSVLFTFNLGTEDPDYRRVWNVATNLLGRACNQEEKEAVFVLLVSHSYLNICEPE